jgi:hypothetical protein
MSNDKIKKILKKNSSQPELTLLAYQVRYEIWIKKIN